jgi:hypothetical protein
MYFVHIGTRVVNAEHVVYVHREASGLVFVRLVDGALTLTGHEADSAWFALTALAAEAYERPTPESDPHNAARPVRPTAPIPLWPHGSLQLNGKAPEGID